MTIIVWLIHFIITLQLNSENFVIACLILPSTSHNNNRHHQEEEEECLRFRLATISDIPQIQKCNQACLPENYPDEFYSHQIKAFPTLAIVAESTSIQIDSHQKDANDGTTTTSRSSSTDTTSRNGRIVGYTIGQIRKRAYSYSSWPKFYLSQPQQDQLKAFHHGKSMDCPQITSGWVISLAVLEGYRNLGLASGLLNHLQNCFQEDYQAVICDLSVRVSNVNAIRLYQQLGYTIDETLIGFYPSGPPEDAYQMSKILRMFAPNNKHSSKFQQPNKESNNKLSLPRYHTVRTVTQSPTNNIVKSDSSIYMEYLDEPKY